MSHLLFVWVVITIAGAVLLFIVSLRVHSKIMLRDGVNSSYVAFRLFKGVFNTRYGLSLKQGVNNPLWLVKTDSTEHDRITVQEMINSIQSSISFYTQNTRLIRYLTSKARLHRLSVAMRIGTGEAASTALTSAFVYNLLLYTNHYIKCKKPSAKITTEVVPVFKDLHFEFHADCIFSLKIGYIIITMIMIAIARLKGDEKRATAPN